MTRWHCVDCAFTGILMGNPTTADWINARTEVLEHSDDSDALRVAAEELAWSDSPQALEVLGAYLARADVLSRLDPVDADGATAGNLRDVMQPLIERSSPEVVALSLRLFGAAEFVDGPERLTFLLQAMARVAPMSDAVIEAFRQANGIGYFNLDARLLSENASEPALSLLESMLIDTSVDVEERVSCVHACIVHRRTREPIVELAWHLADRSGEPDIVTAAIESVFDYQRRWFSLHTPLPPSWRTADEKTLQRVVDFGVRAKRQPVLSDELQAAVDTTIETARGLLAIRGR